jgi:uncharacterized membrane protein YhaH (DUF805 family)
MEAIISRVDRKSYWIRYAIVFIISLFLFSTEGGFPNNVVFLALNLYVILIGIGRMHDVNKSGWCILIPIYNLILALKEGDQGVNSYGAQPIKIDEVESVYLYPMIMSILMSLFFACLIYFILDQTKILSVFSNEESLKSIFFALSFILTSLFILNSSLTNKSNP